MSEFERTILERLESLESEIARLKSEKSAADRATEFERLPLNATVGKEYVAYRFGCSLEAVLRGRAGTHKIRRVSRKPLKFIKRDVDAVWRELSRTVAEDVDAAIRESRPVRRRSIIAKSL